MIEAGLQLMVLGMSVVFVFLIILVALMTLMSMIARRFESPAAEIAGDAPSPSVSGAASDSHKNPQIAAVLAAVAQHHRRRHGDAAETPRTHVLTPHQEITDEEN
ncbi:MAG: OadG family protein [Alkalispirochaeta sp.]